MHGLSQCGEARGETSAQPRLAPRFAGALLRDSFYGIGSICSPFPAHSRCWVLTGGLSAACCSPPGWHWARTAKKLHQEPGEALGRCGKWVPCARPGQGAGVLRNNPKWLSTVWHSSARLSLARHELGAKPSPCRGRTWLSHHGNGGRAPVLLACAQVPLTSLRIITFSQIK